jgi:hypothetical protein
VIEGGNSYRGVATNLEILSRTHRLESPNYNSIRSWVGRIGLYELSRKKEKREDWIFLIDFTLELGKEKAMVIYGISEESWKERVLGEKRGLKHTDGEILGIEVTESATGEWVQNILEKLKETVGSPCQIISDQGSNLKKGIELYQENNQDVIATYDVTHGMANLLKKELASSEIYQEFLTDCSRCKQQLKQTELAFLAPPSQRSQCRYFNAERLVDWATKLLNCPLDILSNLLEKLELDQLESRLKEKFSWLGKYLKTIPLWKTMIQMTRTLEKQLKVFGLNQESLTLFLENLSDLKIPASLDSFQEKIINYLKFEMEKIRDDRTIIATTDVLESIFGKYKRFSQRCPLKEFRQMLLTIPLCTIDLTSELIQKALSTVPCHKLSEWLNDVFGLSMLSKRKTVFKATFDDMKVA